MLVVRTVSQKKLSRRQTPPDRAKSIVQGSGKCGWLSESGSFAVLNNGIEFAAT